MAAGFKGLRIRALVLAAGLGQRLRPLTNMVPKPLLPVLGRPSAALSLERLADVGCEEAALNLHHLGESVEQALGQESAGVPLRYSIEPVLLGTLGALRPLRAFLADADLVILLNSDSLCRWPLRQLIRRHLKSGAKATLMLSRTTPVQAFGSGVGVDQEQRIVDFRLRPGQRSRAVARYVFTGVHVLQPEIVDAIAGDDDQPGDIVGELYEPMLERGEQIQGVVSKQRWHDLGTAARYLVGVLDWARGRQPLRAFRHRWVASTARLDSGVKVKRSVVEEDAAIGRRSRLDSSVVLAGAKVGEGCRLIETIVAPGVEVPAGATIAARMITPLKSGRDPQGRDSVVGNLVYTPIGQDAQ